MRSKVLMFGFVVACGAAQSVAPPPPTPPVRNATGSDDVRQLFLAMAQQKVCSQLEGKWLGLPAQDDTASTCPKNLEGADSGLACTWGRLQIRECKSALQNESLALSFGGVGWTWVDQRSGDVAVRQYVYLSINVELSGAFDVGYAKEAHVASVWLTPTQPTKARVQALGIIKLTANGILGELEKLAAGALGVDPKHLVAVQGAAQFEDKLRKGMTITFDTQSQQVDLMLGALPNGVVPNRPMPNGDKPWLLNERQEVFPGGLHVAGPFEPAAAVKLDAKWEGGAATTYGIACARDAMLATDALARGDKPSLEVQSSGQIEGPNVISRVLSPPGCPWVLLTRPASLSSARAALELTPVDPSTLDGGAAPPPPTVSSATVWVTVMGFDFETHKPDGKPWDFGGGAPDPEIWLRAGSGTKFVIVKQMKDTFRASPMLRAPAAVEVTATSPLVIGATDIDEVSDDPMGEATVTLNDVLSRGRDLEVETKLKGVRTGTLRLRVERGQ